MNTVARTYAIILPWSNQQKATNSTNVLAFSLYTKHSFKSKYYGPNSTPLEVKGHLDLTKGILSVIGITASDFEGVETILCQVSFELCSNRDNWQFKVVFIYASSSSFLTEYFFYSDFLYCKAQLYFLKILLLGSTLLQASTRSVFRGKKWRMPLHTLHNRRKSRTFHKGKQECSSYSFWLFLNWMAGSYKLKENK